MVSSDVDLTRWSDEVLAAAERSPPAKALDGDVEKPTEAANTTKIGEHVVEQSTTGTVSTTSGASSSGIGVPHVTSAATTTSGARQKISRGSIPPPSKRSINPGALSQMPAAQIRMPIERSSSRLQVRVLRQSLGYLHHHINAEDPVPQNFLDHELFKIFDERRFYGDSPSTRFQAYRRSLESTDIHTVSSFMLQVLHQGVFSISTLVVCVIYMARLKGVTDFPLHKYTWRPLLMMALLLADKVYEDKPVKNKSLLKLFPIMTAEQFAQLEHTFVKKLTWKHIIVKPSVFERMCREILGFKHEDWS